MPFPPPTPSESGIAPSPAATCPETGHHDARIARFGVYGSGARTRQRYRCTPPSGAPAHYFSLPITPDPATGPPAWAHKYSVDQVARALLAIGRGASYRQASISAFGTGRASSDLIRPDGQQVARWIDGFGRAVLDRQAADAAQPIPGLLGLGGIPSSERSCALLIATWHELGSGGVGIHAVGAAPSLAPTQWEMFLARIEIRPTTSVVVGSSSAAACEPLRGRRATVLVGSDPFPSAAPQLDPALDPALEVEAHSRVADQVRTRTADLVARFGAVSSRFRVVRDATRRQILLELARQELNGRASLEAYTAALCPPPTTR